jgi:glycerol-3-phosphate dehydrogenase
VLKLAASDPSLALPLLEGEAPIRAQVVYAVRTEMALTVEDVLARRIGLQNYSWRLAIEAAPSVGALLRQELRWNSEHEDSAVSQYVSKVNHMIASAGQEPESLPTFDKDLVFKRS